MNAAVETHERPTEVLMIAIYRFVVAGLALLGILSMVVFAMLPIVLVVDEPVAFWVSLASLGFGALVLALLAAGSAIVGFGLLRMRPWARGAAVVLAFLGIPNFPIGTAASVLTLIYLLGAEGQKAFDE